jgi:hypothetical protein
MGRIGRPPAVEERHREPGGHWDARAARRFHWCSGGGTTRSPEALRGGASGLKELWGRSEEDCDRDGRRKREATLKRSGRSEEQSKRREEKLKKEAPTETNEEGA